MLKVLGSMLILLASVGFGFQIQMDLKNHLRLLYDIRKLLFDIAMKQRIRWIPWRLCWNIRYIAESISK